MFGPKRRHEELARRRRLQQGAAGDSSEVVGEASSSTDHVVASAAMTSVPPWNGTILSAGVGPYHPLAIVAKEQGRIGRLAENGDMIHALHKIPHHARALLWLDLTGPCAGMGGGTANGERYSRDKEIVDLARYVVCKPWEYAFVFNENAGPTLEACFKNSQELLSEAAQVRVQWSPACCGHRPAHRASIDPGPLRLVTNSLTLVQGLSRRAVSLGRSVASLCRCVLPESVASARKLIAI